jgi:MoxR-like ATPase
MSLSTTTVEISRLPLGLVAGAYNRFNKNPLPGANKSDCVRWLAENVESGHLLLSEIKAAPHGTLNAAPAAPAFDPAVTVKLDAAGATASIAHANALTALEKIESLFQSVDKHAAASTILNSKVAQLDRKVGDFKVDDDAIARAVAEVVAAEFAPFKQAVADASAEAIIGDLSAVHVVEHKTFGEVFGVHVLNAKNQPMTVAIWNDPSAPAVDPDFIWTADILRHLALSEKTGENAWFGGEKGTGKSETARQFAAMTGRAFKRINFHKHTSAEEYLGATGLVDGNTHFQPRDFLTAYTSPSTVILLDEITNADPGELAPLNGFLEPNAAVSFGGQVWRRAPGVLVFAADNTFGCGDDSGRYSGTRTQNVALIDRFARVIPFTFLPQHEEINAIAKRAGCNKALAEYVHAAIRAARAKVETAEIVDAPSIRSVIAFIKALDVLHPRQAWETTVVARQPSEGHAVLRGLYQACINEETIANYL